MSLKWTGNHNSESGILRKSDFKEKKEELFVFGYSCKLFRDDEKALQIDQGKHLIPWMGDETLKIDRYDARGALHDLSRVEAPSGGYDWRIELTKGELDVEQLCDEERYRALHTNEDEEEMYKEEELKRLHAAGYGQVGFNYDAPSVPSPLEQPVEIDEPFEPTPALREMLSADIILPEGQKQNAIVEKTAKFIASQSQGAQVEILIKAKQRDNPQFKFLEKESPLHEYYNALINLVKAGKWPEKIPEPVEERPPENEEYLHPSLAPAVIESAPQIPSIQYKPSADCDYTLLVSKLRGDELTPAPGELLPPGTEPSHPAVLQRPPLLYSQEPQIPVTQTVAYQQQYAAFYQAVAQPTLAETQAPSNTHHHITKSTGLSLMTHYNTDSDSDDSDSGDSSSNNSNKKPIPIPPDDVKVVVDKMAAYVARNGDEFEAIVRSKNDPRFTFLDPSNEYHAFYTKLMHEKRMDVNGSSDKKNVPVSFSIKKQKEPESVLPRPALPYESTTDDDSDAKDTDKEEKHEVKEVPKTNIPQIISTNNAIPQAVVYKLEGSQNNLPIVKTIEAKPKTVPKVVPNVTPNVTPNVIPDVIPKAVPNTVPHPVQEVKLVATPIVIENSVQEKLVENASKRNVKDEKSVASEQKKLKEKYRERESGRKEKHKHKKSEYRSKSASRETRKSVRSSEREKRRRKEREEERKRRKPSKDELESEIISLGDVSDEMIDLTGDQSDNKEDREGERAKQADRKRRAAEFLRKVGVEPPASALTNSSLASAMADTLETLRKKKVEEDEKKRRKDKRHKRGRYDYDGDSDRLHRKSKRKKNRSSDDDESDHEGSKRKRRKKDKKHSSSRNKKKKRKQEEEEIESEPEPLSIDLTNTLKELRSCSPTKEFVLQETEDTQHSFPKRSSSSSDEEKKAIAKRKKEDREYSEGEWSSDSEEDSDDTPSKKE